MPNNILFKWEDSEALKHHCGFCERPLNHPRAKTSCFGDHAEPCHRFHQAMFMRLRAHTCNYCRTIDEAHWQRHNEIAKLLLNVYESCGETEWAIKPVANEQRGRTRTTVYTSLATDELDHHTTSEESTPTKREKKDAKHLARAASRTRVVKDDDIKYIQSVFHLAEGLGAMNGDCPQNEGEVNEIERHLKYNAHLYHMRSEHHNSKKFVGASSSDLDVDFDTEMARILETLSVTELIDRNTKNRGLQGKELKTFENLVVEFKSLLVEDLVLAKKDALEIKMRRAGYLRYINKSAYSIVEERYSNKDWKTGERLTSISSNSSGALIAGEERGSPQRTSLKDVGLVSSSPQFSPHRRHLDSIDAHVTGQDGVSGKIIELYHVPLLSLRAGLSPREKSGSLKIVASNNANIPVDLTTSQTQKLQSWHTFVNGKELWTVTNHLRPAKPYLQSVFMRQHFSSSLLDHMYSARLGESGLSTSYTALGNSSLKKKIAAPAVQPLDTTTSKTTAEPEQFVACTSEQLVQIQNKPPTMSNKKVKKASWEVKRKLRKADFVAKIMNEDGEVENNVKHKSLLQMEEETNQVSSLNDAEASITGDKSLTDEETVSTQEHEIKLHRSANPYAAYFEDIEDELEAFTEIADNYDSTTLIEISQPEPVEMVRSETTLPVATYKKHLHWTKFTRAFAVDQPTLPSLQPYDSCEQGDTCPFEANKVRDCPFHLPCCPRCENPFLKTVLIVFPHKKACNIGPVNFLRGEKLLRMFEKDDYTKGRLMLLDEHVYQYITEGPGFDAGAPSRRVEGLVPDRLAAEFSEYKYNGYEGPLMQQKKQYNRRLLKNKHFVHPITQKILNDMVQFKFERSNARYMCYCHDYLPKGGFNPGTMVECSHSQCEVVYYHKHCIRGMGYDKVTHWFCKFCEGKLKYLATRSEYVQDHFWNGKTFEELHREFDQKVLGYINNTNDELVEGHRELFSTSLIKSGLRVHDEECMKIEEAMKNVKGLKVMGVSRVSDTALELQIEIPKNKAAVPGVKDGVIGVKNGGVWMKVPKKDNAETVKKEGTMLKVHKKEGSQTKREPSGVKKGKSKAVDQ